jgi:hypothetical protein
MPIALVLPIAAIVLFGGTISLLTLLPPFRRHGRRAGAGIACALAWIAAVAAFGIWTRVSAGVAYIFGTITVVDTFKAGPREQAAPHPADPYKAQVVRELWVRAWMPPPLRPACATHHPEACMWADRIIPAASRMPAWQTYATSVGVALLSGVSSGTLSWIILRRQAVHTRR